MMTMHRSILMNQFPKAIFGSLKAAAKKKAATGTKIIDLSLGSPDLPPAQIVREELAKQAEKADSYGYMLGGTERFHEAVANYYQRRSGVELDQQTEIIQTMGSQEGLVHLPLAFCNPGDIVLTTDPAYVAYAAGIHLAKCEAYAMPLTAEHQFLPDFDVIPEDICARAKMLILNLPGNPVPAMPSVEFFEKAIAFAKKHNLIVIHDAAYSEFYFEGTKSLSFLEVSGAKEVGVEINSLSKSFSLAGARIAYIVGNASIIGTLGELKSHLDYGTFRPIQDAACVALDNAEAITDELRTIFSTRHRVLSEGLEAIGWELAPSAGGMFVYAKYPQQQMNDKEFVYHVIEQTGVVFVPGSIFGASGRNHVRIALVQDEKQLQEAVTRLATL